VRKKHGIDWQEEYILGLVDHGDVVRVSTVLDVSSEVMTQATAHKYLTQLVDKQLIKHNIGDDKRIKVLTLTPKGEKIIKELANVSAIPSLAMS
jgi:hypothetical protein